MSTPENRSTEQRSTRVSVVVASDDVAAVTRSAIEQSGLSVGEVAVRSETEALGEAIERTAPNGDAAAVVLDGREPTRRLLRAIEAATETTPTAVYAPRQHDTGADPREPAPDPAIDWPAVRRRALERAGAVRVGSLGRLVDAVEPLARQPPLSGDSVAIVSNAGGPGVMAADAVGTGGLSLASFEDDTREALDELIPEEGSTANPIDLLGTADLETFATTTDLVLDDANVDAVVVVSAPSALFSFRELAGRLGDVAGGRAVPVVGALMGGKTASEAGSVLSAAGVPVRFDPFAAVDCLTALSRTGSAGAHSTGNPTTADRRPTADVDRSRAEAAIDGGDAEELCRAYGIPTAGEVGADPVDCSLRVVRDPKLGPTVVAGIDPFDDVLGDVAVRLAPLSERDVAELFELRAGPLLRGARGRDPADFDALEALARQCSRIAVEQPTLTRLHLDPVRVGPEGVRVDGASLSCE